MDDYPSGGAAHSGGAFRSSNLDLDRLRAFEHPVYFALRGNSNSGYCGRMAERARTVFSNFTLDVFEDRHQLDPPHRIEPERTANAGRPLSALERMTHPLRRRRDEI